MSPFCSPWLPFALEDSPKTPAHLCDLITYPLVLTQLSSHSSFLAVCLLSQFIPISDPLHLLFPLLGSHILGLYSYVISIQGSYSQATSQDYPI